MYIDRNHNLWILRGAAQWNGETYDICIRPKDASAALNRTYPENIDQTIQSLVQGCLSSLESEIQGNLENIEISVNSKDQETARLTDRVANAVLKSSDQLKQISWRSTESWPHIHNVEDALLEISRQLRLEVVVVLQKPKSFSKPTPGPEPKSDLSIKDERATQSSKAPKSSKQPISEFKPERELSKYKEFFPIWVDLPNDLLEQRLELIRLAIEAFREEFMKVEYSNWTRDLWGNLTFDQLLKIDPLSDSYNKEIQRAVKDNSSPFVLLCNYFLRIDGEKYFEHRLPMKHSENNYQQMLDYLLVNKIKVIWNKTK